MEEGRKEGRGGGIRQRQKREREKGVEREEKKKSPSTGSWMDARGQRAGGQRL